jgi:hypothetical protein
VESIVDLEEDEVGGLGGEIVVIAGMIRGEGGANMKYWFVL